MAGIFAIVSEMFIFLSFNWLASLFIMSFSYSFLFTGTAGGIKSFFTKNIQEVWVAWARLYPLKTKKYEEENKCCGIGFSNHKILKKV